MRTWTSYRRALSRDVSFAFTAKTLAFVVAASFVLFLLLGVLGRWAVVYSDSEATQTWKEYVLGMQGAIDGKPEAGAASVLYSAFVRLVAAIVIGGVLTSFLCALAERFSQMKLQGLLVPALHDHFVIFGYNEITNDLIRALLVPDPRSGEDFARWIPLEGALSDSAEVSHRRVLLVTSHPVEQVRANLDVAFPRSLTKRIVCASGDTTAGSMKEGAGFLDSLSLTHARQVYVVGDGKEFDEGDIPNLSFARMIGSHLSASAGKCGKNLATPVPIFVRLDGTTSFDLVKKISFLLPGQTQISPQTFFKPFSFFEGWSRRVFGGTEAVFGESGVTDYSPFPPLDFAPMADQTYVHFIVVGLSPMGEALVVETTRVCHFPKGRKSIITIVDERSDLWDSFLARHPGIESQLPDIEIRFLGATPDAPCTRKLLQEAASDTACLLTVAVCLSPPDRALEVSLSLPEEVYWHRLPAKKRTVRDHYRENGPRILVYQEHRDGLGEAADLSERFENLRVFGMREHGLNLDCIREFPAMYLNAVYDWPRESDGSLWIDHVVNPSESLPERIRLFREKWRDQLASENPFGVFEIDADEKYALLRDILCSGGLREIRRFQEYSFRKYLLLKPELRWANVYVSDSWGTVFRALGLRAVRDAGMPCEERIRINDSLFADGRKPQEANRALFEMEHNRWIADRVLMGYRAPRPGSGEVRDDTFRYHVDIVPFDHLSQAEIGKDELSIRCIPLFAALEGFRLERLSKSNA